MAISLDRVTRKLISLRHGRRRLGPPSAEDQRRIDDLRVAIAQVPELVPFGESSLEAAWATFSNGIRRSVLENDPRGFLNWAVIGQTMFCEPPTIELNALRKLPDWERWERAVRESPAGNPRPYHALWHSSGNLIHHGYHLSQLLRLADCRVEDWRQVVEFGAGYGSMCRLVRQLGFRGRYVSFDLPVLTCLQEYFLKSCGVQAEITRTVSYDEEDCVVLLSDVNEFTAQLAGTGTDVFIATWSLSESPLDLRDRVLSAAEDPRYYLIAYQHRFGEIDNVRYFDDLMRRHHRHEWRDWEIEHLKGNRYLVGWRRANG